MNATIVTRETPTRYVDARVRPFAISANGPPRRQLLYVHKCNGETAVIPATGIALTQDELIVFNGEQIVAVFDRADVYFACRIITVPPPAA